LLAATSPRYLSRSAIASRLVFAVPVRKTCLPAASRPANTRTWYVVPRLRMSGRSSAEPLAVPLVVAMLPSVGTLGGQDVGQRSSPGILIGSCRDSKPQVRGPV